jgi:nicotinamide mononucleotide transporter
MAVVTVSMYGWYKWTRKIKKPVLKITKSTRQNWYFASVLFLLSGFVILMLLHLFKGDDTAYWSTFVPYIDTVTTAIFIVGMWLMAIKKLENWLFWIVGDLVSVPLYAYKGLMFTSFQFTVFLILAILGYRAWKKKLELKTT